jgi:hypothetical protein
MHPAMKDTYTTRLLAKIAKPSYREMARRIGRSPDTIFSWRARGRIPSRNWPALARDAQRLGLSIEVVDFLAADLNERLSRDRSVGRERCGSK